MGKKNKVIIGILLSILLFMASAYAAFQTKLNINGTSNITSNWDIKITNVKEVNKGGNAENSGDPIWNDLTAYIEANLYTKNDFIEYDITIENKGTLDAKLENIKENITSSNDAIKISLSNYTKGEKLSKGQSQTIKARIEFNPEFKGDIEEGSAEINLELNYTQNNDYKEENGIISSPERYLVNYECDNCENYNEYLKEGDIINLSYIQEKEYYEFLGWNTDKEAKEPLNQLKMENHAITLYPIFKNTIPICEITVKEATYKTVTLETNCVEQENIDNYKITNNEEILENTTKSTYTLNNFDLSKTTISVTNNQGNTKDFTLNKVNLDKGYQMIYEAINKEYEKLKTTIQDYQTTFLDKIYPIGSIYISTNETDPSEIFGGTWERFAQGRTLLGATANQSSEITGGNENITLATTNIPAHTHTITPAGTVTSTFKGNSLTTSSAGDHTHTINYTTTKVTGENYPNAGLSTSDGGFYNRVIVSGASKTTSSSGAHTHTYTATGTVASTFKGTSITTSSTGSNQSINIMNPYIVTYMWKRIE